MHDGRTPASQPGGSLKIAIVALVLVNAIWGASFPLMKCLNLIVDQHFSVTELSASTPLRTAAASLIVALRFGLALILFIVCFPKTLQAAHYKQWAIGFAIGAVFFFGMLLQVMGLATIPASRSGFLTSLAVVFTPLAVSALHLQRPRRLALIGAAIALLGVSFLTGFIVWDGRQVRIAESAVTQWSIGDTYTTIATMFFSAQIVLIDYFGKRYDSLAFTPGMFVTATVLGAVAFLMSAWRIPETAANAWWTLASDFEFVTLIVILSVVASLLAFSLMNKYQPAVSAVQASVIYTLEPLFATSWAMILPVSLSAMCSVSYINERISWSLIIGGGTIILANIVALYPTQKRAA